MAHRQRAAIGQAHKPAKRLRSEGVAQVSSSLDDDALLWGVMFEKGNGSEALRAPTALPVRFPSVE